MAQVRRLAVLTSGGDAPGMNAAIRAVTRSASEAGIQTYGVEDGFVGLAKARWQPLDDRAVAGILQRGGTMLGSARFPEFRQLDAQRECAEQLAAAGIDAVVVIGGNGSQQGSLALSRLGVALVGVASTIDNDLAVTETSIGVDTALNTAVVAIDRLKDTASSHHRAFVIEVMGRDSGYLALMAALATGAELALVPEREIDPETVAEDVQAAYARGKTHYILIAAEGAQLKAGAITRYLVEHPCAFEARLTVLGHVQRGGSPTAFDRVLAGRLGVAAVRALAAGRSGVVAGWVGGKVAEIPLTEAVASQPKVTDEMLRLARLLAR
jgi:6-phosphofructokinase 1